MNRFFIVLVSGVIGLMQTLMAQDTTKRLSVLKIDREVTAADLVPAMLDSNKIGFQSIDRLNWLEYPYKPAVKFRIAFTASCILIHFKVSERSVRAIAGKDNGRVWEDSCVEFFIQPDTNQLTYYNLEFNCAGALLIQGGPPGNRSFANDNVLSGVKRWSSLGRKAFAEKIGNVTWEFAAIIPFTTFFRHRITSLDGKTLKANFYKCGDGLKNPHYLSWSPIDLPKPQFHAPQFFGYLDFD